MGSGEDADRHGPSLSLIVATLGRAETLLALIESLRRQTCQGFELIFADQNPDDRVPDLLAAYSGALRVRHLRCPPGLSAARNCGLAEAAGAWVSFPDDDCRYPPSCVAAARNWLEAHPEAAGVSGRISCGPAKAGHFMRQDARGGPITESNAWRRACSATLFVRTDAVRAIGGFDESLGLGAPTRWQAGEDTDLVLRLREAGYRIWYEPALEIEHPPVDGRDLDRAYQYGLGIGHVLAKHGVAAGDLVPHLVRPLGGAAVGLFTLRPAEARYHWAAFRGRLAGWRGAT